MAPRFCGKLPKARRLLVGRESRPSPSLGEASSSIARGSRQAEHQEMCALVPTWGEVPVAGLGKVWGRKMVNWSFSSLAGLGSTKSSQFWIWGMFEKVGVPGKTLEVLRGSSLEPVLALVGTVARDGCQRRGEPCCWMSSFIFIVK